MTATVGTSSDGRRALVVDSNLLVLLVVGLVNPDRIASFKRTRRYNEDAFNLLREILQGYESIYTTAHILTEVSNLTDLDGKEFLKAREVLRELISGLGEAVVASARAAELSIYPRLGLVDAVISCVALEQNCEVLTDDVDLYNALWRDGVTAYNFTHLRAQRFRL